MVLPLAQGLEFTCPLSSEIILTFVLLVIFGYIFFEFLSLSYSTLRDKMKYSSRQTERMNKDDSFVYWVG